MPLIIRTDNVANREELIVDVPKEDGGGQDYDGITKTIGFMSISFGIPKIEEKNADEVFRRLKELERVWGALMHDGKGNGVFFTLEDITRRIGMTTNVTPKTKAAFAKVISRAEKENSTT